MKKRNSMLLGVALILIGCVSLALATALPVLGIGLWRWGPWRLWPLVILGLGLLFVLPPILPALGSQAQVVRGRPGLGALFIPGIPILTTGAILLLASVFNWWNVWEWLWPQEVLALAMGFLIAAIYTRSIWLVVPAIILGLNGLVFQFCAITGLWEAWAVLWTVVPLSIGLALLAVSAKTRSVGLIVAGLFFCGFAAAGLVVMTAILSMAALLSGLWLLNLVGPAMLILAGLALVVWGFMRGQRSTSLVVRETTENGYGSQEPRLAYRVPLLDSQSRPSSWRS